MQLLLEELLRRELRQVTGHADATGIEFEKLNGFIPGLLAQDQTDRCFFARLHFVLLEPSEIELHLPFVGRLKGFQLQFNRNKTAQLPVVEQQIDVVVFAVNYDAFLAGNEGKAN